MRIVIKRIVAYVIDIILVSLISTFITSNAYINKDYNKYLDAYEGYEILTEEYNESTSKLEIEYEDNEINDEEYNSKLEKLNEEYNDKSIDYNYKLVKLSLIPTIISILTILLYFVVIQFYFNGQTLGKKLMKLRIKSNNNKSLNLLNYFLRCLIVNEVLINVINLSCVLLLSESNYIIANQIIYIITYVLEITILVMLAFDKNNRSVHDYIANTKVVEENKNEV